MKKSNRSMFSFLVSLHKWKKKHISKFRYSFGTKWSIGIDPSVWCSAPAYYWSSRTLSSLNLQCPYFTIELRRRKKNRFSLIIPSLPEWRHSPHNLTSHSRRAIQHALHVSHTIGLIDFRAILCAITAADRFQQTSPSLAFARHINNTQINNNN